jgi:dihydrofolate reductase
VGRLIYSAIASADGYVEDASGDFQWAAPGEQVLEFLNDTEREVGAYLYGRRMYETMRYWETADSDSAASPGAADFARIWRAADKIVFSRTLPSVQTARTRLERELNREQIASLKAAATRDLTIGGAELAGRALTLGLVDELHLYLGPVIVGGGKPAIAAGSRADLELLASRAFSDGTVYLRYRVRT